MRIGIDVDNTITDTLPAFKKYCKKYNEEVVKRNIKMNEYGFAMTNLYDWTEEEKRDCYLKYIDKAREEGILKPKAKEIIEKLKAENNSIYIITARKHGVLDPYETTKKYLEKNGIIYDNLAIQKDKKQYCIDNNIDILIDDEPQNINEVSKIIPVIVFEWKHNEQCDGNNIIKVKSWDETYNVIKEIEKKGDK
ncbi:MAG: hypothetical protein HFJ58_03610 [Clostridia bacterium]|nr:hypothetical protein [Clostridia bacterium]